MKPKAMIVLVARYKRLPSIKGVDKHEILRKGGTIPIEGLKFKGDSTWDFYLDRRAFLDSC